MINDILGGVLLRAKFRFHEMRKIVMKKPSIKNIIIILLIVLVLFGIYCFAHFAYVASAM